MNELFKESGGKLDFRTARYNGSVGEEAKRYRISDI